MILGVLDFIEDCEFFAIFYKCALAESEYKTKSRAKKSIVSSVYFLVPFGRSSLSQ